MDEKGRLLLKHVEQIFQETLSTRKGKQAQAEQQERILQSLHALLTACEAKLFSKECVKEFLEGVARVLSETTLSSKNPDLVRRCLNKAIKLARGPFSSDLEKRLKALLPEDLGISDDSRASNARLEAVAVPPRGNRWYQAYFKPLLRLCEFYQDNPEAPKKLSFSGIVQEALKFFLVIIKDKNSSLDANTRKAMLALIQKIANKPDLEAVRMECQSLMNNSSYSTVGADVSNTPECRLPFDLLSFFQEEGFNKERAQAFVSLMQSLAEVCLQAKENHEAYGLLDKAIVLADHFNLVTNKVTLTILQGKVFGVDQTSSQFEALPVEKIKTQLDSYFEALPIAEEKAENGYVEQLNTLTQAITVLEKRFLYQTIAPWVKVSFAQAIESNSEVIINEKWERFLALSRALVACHLLEQAWDCLYQCQTVLTNRLKYLQSAVFEALVSVSSEKAEATNGFMDAQTSGEWQQYRLQLVSYRKILERGIKEPKHFLDSQIAYTESMKGLMVKFFREGEAWLGTPPEPYAILGLGSISRKTMSPYSDFECVFLLTDPASADWESASTFGAQYFDALYQIFEFKMASLGELRGFHLDKEGHPRKELRLRGTVDKVIKEGKPPLVSIDDAMTYSLVQPCLVHGDEGLWQSYQQQFLLALSQPVLKKDSTPWGHLLAKAFVKFHLRSLSPKSDENKEKQVAEGEDAHLHTEINVKKSFVSPLFYLLCDVCTSKQWFFTYPTQMLERLTKEHLLPADFAQAYQGAMAWADRIRARLHLQYKEQKDVALLPGQSLQSSSNSSQTASDAATVSLTEMEYHALQCIEWGIFCPMHKALEHAQSGVNDALLSPMSALLSMTLLQSQEVFSNRAVFSGVQQDAMRSLIAMLWLANTTPAQYREALLIFPNKALRGLFISTLKKFAVYYEPKFFANIQGVLSDAPYKDGSREEESQALAHFEQTLSSLIVPDSKTKVPILEWVNTEGAKQSGCLHPKFVESLQKGKLLDSKGKFQLSEKRVNLPGRHLVFALSCLIGGQQVRFHIKFYPEMPGLEYAAGTLARLLVGWGAPYVKLARFVEGDKKYPVLISQTVEGELLSDLLKKSNANELHSHLDPKRFSQRVVIDLLLNPEDAKPSNYIAVINPNSGLYSLVCIDNDRSFFPALMVENGQVVPIVKNITYCFAAMNQPLDELVCVDIHYIDPFLLLKKWLHEADNFNRHLKILFSNKEVEKFFPKNPSAQRFSQLTQNVIAKDPIKVKESILPIVLREQVAAQLYTKLVRFERYLIKYSQATSQQLLGYVEPYLSKYYGNLLKYYPQIDERFQQGFARLYSEKRDKKGTQQTLKTTFATLQTFHGKPVNSEEFLSKREVSIQEAIDELSATRDSQTTWELIFQSLQTGVDNGILEFIKLPDLKLHSKIISQLDFRKLTADFELKFWNAILPLEVSFQKLILHNSRINLTQFEQLLSATKELRLLTLENCQALSDATLTLIAQYCPIVERLRLIQLPFTLVDIRQSLIRKLFTPLGAKDPGVFEELRSLSIQNCPALSELYLQAPALTHLEMRNCPKFVRGTVNSTVLREVKVINAPKLTQSALSKLVQEASDLKIFELTQCPELKALPFYQRFPYLLPLDVTGFSQRWLNGFIALLEPYEPRKLSEEQVRQMVAALKTYFRSIEKFKDALFTSVKDLSRDVNISALLSLGQLGWADPSVLQVLEAQGDAHPHVRQAAQIALLMLQEQTASAETIKIVEAALSSLEPMVVQGAERALIMLPNYTEKIAEDLASKLPTLLNEGKKMVYALSSLSLLTHAIPSVISALDSVLVTTHPSIIQSYTLYAFAQMGEFESCFSRKNAYFQALGRDSFLYAALLAELRDLDLRFAELFKAKMLPLNKSLPSAVLSPEIQRQVKDQRWDQRKEAINQIRDLKLDTKEIRALLFEAARDLSHQVRQVAIETLTNLPVTDTLMGEAFLRALKDKEHLVCEAGLQGFKRHTVLVTKDLFPLIEQVARGESATSTRRVTAMMLSHCPARYSEGYEQLYWLVVNDNYTEVKQAAMDALLSWMSFNQLGVYLKELYNKIKQDEELKQQKAQVLKDSGKLVPLERAKNNLGQMLAPRGASSSGVLGSTYFGVEKSLQKEKTICMDANYQQGHTGATSDGYGHFLDMALNKDIQQAAYRTVKLATRYADFYSSAELLFSDLPRLFQQLGQSVKQDAMHPESSGTVSCVLTKLYSHESNPSLCTVVAAGVGDGMVFVFDPSTQHVEVLVKPRQYNRGTHFSPVSITEALQGGILQRRMMHISSGAFVVRCTDGIWQSLPHLRSDVLVDPSNQKQYLEYTLNIAALKPELTLFSTQFPQANAIKFQKWLIQTVQKSIEKQKSFLIQEIHTLNGKIQRFGKRNNANVSDFLAWVGQTDPNYSKTIWKFFEELHIAKDKVRDARMEDFLHQLNKIHPGDDIALNVEEVRAQEELQPVLGMKM
jgi:hypothetical protein